MQVLKGPDVAAARKAKLIQDVEAFTQKVGMPPTLAVILVGENPASQVYVKNKHKMCESVGMRSLKIELPASISETQLQLQIEKLNINASVHGILVQLPLPETINTNRILDMIRASKDPDGLTTENLGLLIAGRKRVAPCTPAGVMVLLEHYQIPVAGRHVVVVGRSNIVGKPMAQLLLEANATVTICHSKTQNLEEHTRSGDIVVVAAGQARFLGKSAFKQGAVVVDVGMHRPDGASLCGDVRYEELDGWVSAATPVPGGVGPMTIQMLMENTMYLAKQTVPALRGS